MALFPVSYTLPQVLAVAVAGQLLFYLNLLGPELGYRVVFGTAAIWFFFATVFMRMIRGVRQLARRTRPPAGCRWRLSRSLKGAPQTGLRGAGLQESRRGL